MHDCLYNQDIVEVIFDFVYANPSGRSAINTLLQLALTCRTLGEVALDTLWHTQTSLVPLIKCVPVDAWQETPSEGSERTLNMLRPLTSKDFIRFDTYAQRIRRLNYIRYPWHRSATFPYDLTCLSVIRTYHDGKPLLPNLRWLLFNHILHATFSAHLFLESGLISFSLPWSDSDTDVKFLYPMLLKLSPDLEELDLGNTNVQAIGDSSELSDFVLRTTQLRVLRCGNRRLTTAAIVHLATLPYLTTLQLQNTAHHFLPTVISESGSLFSALQQLHVKETHLPSFAVLAKHLSQLKTLILDLEQLPTALDMKQFFEALRNSSSWFTLETLQLSQAWESNPGQEPHVDEEIFINISVLEPLLFMENLKKLDLNMRCSFSLTNLDIGNIASAWPKMRYLQFGSRLGWDRISAITLEGLLNLLLRCPDLEHLGFVLDASYPSFQLPSKRYMNNKITYLHLGDSIFTDATYVAEFLSRVLPNLAGIGTARQYYAAAEPLTMTQAEQERRKLTDWDRVVDVLTEIRAYRKRRMCAMRAFVSAEALDMDRY